MRFGQGKEDTDRCKAVWWICLITAWTIAEERGSCWACCCEFTQNLMSPICHLCIQQEFCHWLERQQNKPKIRHGVMSLVHSFAAFFLRDTEPPVTTLAHALVTASQKGKLGLQHFVLCSKMTAVWLHLEKYPSDVMTFSLLLPRSGLITSLPSCPESKI